MKIITIEGNVVPKARPRVTQNGTYMPTNYSNWKKLAVIEMRLQSEPLTGKGYELTIILTGKHSRRGDLDNVAGSIMDALVQAGIIKGDNMMIIKKLSIELQYSKDDPIAEIVLVEV